MKILFLSQIVPYPPKGGVLQRSYNILKEMSKENDVHLLAFVHLDILDSKEKVQEAKLHLGEFCTSIHFIELEVKKSRLVFLRKLIRSIFSSKPFSFIAHESQVFEKKIEHLCATHNFDLIHFDTIALAQYLTHSTAASRTLTHHNIESELMMRRANTADTFLHRSYLAMNGRKLQRYEKKFCALFSINITCSEDDKRKLASLSDSSTKIEVVPNGVDTTYFQPEFGFEKDNSIIHIGGLQSANLDGINHFLSEIWPLIKNIQPRATLTLVGGSAPDNIKKRSREDPDIQLTGFVDDIRPHAREAAVMVVPLRFGGGTKLKVLDGLAMGKAMVSTSVGTEGINLQNHKHLIIADSPEIFARQVCVLLSEPERRLVLGKNGRALVEEQYDWRKIGELQREINNRALEMR